METPLESNNELDTHIDMHILQPPGRLCKVNKQGLIFAPRRMDNGDIWEDVISTKNTTFAFTGAMWWV